MGFGDVLGDILVGAVDVLTRPVPGGSILESILTDPQPMAPTQIIVRNQPPLAAPSPRLGPSPGNSAPPVSPIPFGGGGFGGPQMADFPGGFTPVAGFPFFDVVPPGGGAGVTLFRAPGISGARPRSLVMVPNPTTGKPTFFKHAGTPILFSGDLRAARRVQRVAARARKSRR